MNTLRLVLLAIMVGLVGCANEPRSRDTANPNVSGETLALQVCSNCHGATGNAKSPNFPNLAGQQEAYVVAQLSAFRSQNRRDPAGFEYMWGLSHKLTDKQIKELASHFANEKPERQPVEGRIERIAAGKVIFTGGIPDKGIPPCASCHGSEGQGNAAFPRIAGQHADYLVKQLAAFQRTNERPAATVMETVAHNLTRENVRDVADFAQAVPNQ
ncbi:MAG: cytochrome c4 [Gammaproteobacteria bacterium]|nr:MAG: cytochrome c4 [Gammaproteobacteria bacterium]